MKYPTLYKRTSTGAIQIWYMEVDGLGSYRTISGQEDGKHVTSRWTACVPKNVGRANATTAEEQAILEVEAQYKKKKEQGSYFANRADIDNETFFNPMLAHPFDAARLPEGRFYVQPKHNGVRCIAKRDGLWSRKGKRFVNCPHIEAELKPFFDKYPHAKLDGELYNHDYKEDFEKLISAIKKQKPTPETIALAKEVVELHIYDYPSHPGSFGQRWADLEIEFANTIPENKTIRRSPTWSSTSLETIHGLHKRNKDLGYEGTMIRLDSPYENKRTFALMKYKDFLDDEFEIVNIEPGLGNWSDAAKIITCKLPDGRTFGSGFKGSKEEAKDFLERRYEIIGKFGTVVFQNYSADGIPIFPIFHGVRDYE